ncbi:MULTISPECIES: hypothetical protein [unclassified Pseudomonas]|uniref:hypothetical protein n=1 Tax=unclassified Pseudomonas TaxID=196821 RepID=UPI001CC11572|nr:MULTISPECIES: hypothetical protein [unclassified Pseudomonas]
MAAFFMPMTPYLVSEFAKPTLTNLVRECFGDDFPDIFSKDQVDYLFTYLTCLDAKTVLLEFNYVDKDYLEDFSRYYVKRFGNDGHKCARLHFFSSSVDHRTITSILQRGKDAGSEIDDLNKSYLGFMVIKPLPRTFIGKTCLKVMPDELSENKCKRRLAREYTVDLFGISLKVESIAFQEQDKVVAACATTAIWASLHALKLRNTRSIHSCSEITINAINHVEDSSNSFPSQQLSNKQILRSLDVEGLRYHAKSMEAPDQAYFLQSIIAHIDSSLPMILTGEVFSHVTTIATLPAVNADVDTATAPVIPLGASETQDLTDSGGGQTAKPVFRARGGHAICVVGYKVDQDEEVLYVHDDRLGPYARAKLISIDDYTLIEGAAPREIKWALGLQRMKNKDEWEEPHELITPDFSVVPCDRKARLPFLYVYETCQVIVKELKNMAMAGGEQLSSLSQKIELREISDIRREVLEHEPTATTLEGNGFRTVTPEEREAWQVEKVEFLTTSYARLQWVVSFNWLGAPLFKVLIDASEIPQGNAVSAILAYDICLGNVLLDLIRESADPNEVVVNSGHFYQSFLRRLMKDKSSRAKHLDDTYGSPRAPKNLRESEFEGGNIVLNRTLETLYEPNGKKLLDMFPSFADGSVGNLIWAVSLEGDLLIAAEYDGRGHPSITGFKPARIAGEIRRSPTGDVLLINVESGRYSRDYNNRIELLGNAKVRFERYFPEQSFDIQVIEGR